MGTLRKDNNRLEFSSTALKQLQDIAGDNTLINPGDMWFSTSPTTTGQVAYVITSDDPIESLCAKDHLKYTKEKTELDNLIAHYYGRSLLI